VGGFRITLHLLFFSVYQVNLFKDNGEVINLSAIIVDCWLSEYGSKLRRDLLITINGVTPDVFKTPPEIEY